ncbi:MAG: LysR family transcriptional regulator [Candidatus Enteromonas sp.]
MNYAYFKAFCTVARLGNISKAALALDLTQPAVSRIVGNLEKECGTKLFFRSKTGVSLTEEGQRLYAELKDPFDALDRFEKDVLPNPGKPSITLYVGATYTSLSLYCFSFLAKAKKKYPFLNIRIHTDSSKNLIDRVQKGQLDFAFITTPFKSNEGIESTEVMEIEDILIAPKSYESKIEGPISIKELDRFPLILLNPEMQFREHVDRYLLSQGLRILPAYEADSSSVLLPFVEHDCGLTFLPKELALASLAQGKSIEIALKEKIPSRHIAFIARKEANRKPILRKIQEEMFDSTKRSSVKEAKPVRKGEKEARVFSQ